MTTLRAVSAPLTAVRLIFGVVTPGIVSLAVPAAAQELIRPSGAPITVDVSKGVLISLDRPADTVFVADPSIADCACELRELVAREVRSTQTHGTDRLIEDQRTQGIDRALQVSSGKHLNIAQLAVAGCLFEFRREVLEHRLRPRARRQRRG